MTQAKTEKSKQNTCPNIAVFRYTWAGQDESFICLPHSEYLRIVAATCSYNVRLIPIKPNQDITCRQIVN